MKQARAQLAQNLRSKIQYALDGGRWGHAWFLTGQPDPIGRRTFAAPEPQIATIAGYVSAVQKLRGNLGSNIARSAELELEPLPQATGEEQTTPVPKATRKPKR